MPYIASALSFSVFLFNCCFVLCCPVPRPGFVRDASETEEHGTLATIFRRPPPFAPGPGALETLGSVGFGVGGFGFGARCSRLGLRPPSRMCADDREVRAGDSEQQRARKRKGGKEGK